MEQLLIRKATIADAAYISLLARITFREAFGHLFRDNQDLLDYFATSFSVEKFSSSIAKANNIFLLAFDNDLPVGYAKVKKFSPTPFIQASETAQLQKIYVLKDFLSKGIGQLLIDRVFIEMDKLKSEALWLSVYVENPKAIRFYQRNNFTAAGTHTYSIGKETFEFTVMKKAFR